MAETSIEWTRGDDGTPGRTWNPIRGCSLVSKGCQSCYAMKMAHRFSGPGQPYEGLTRLGANGPIWTGDVQLVPEKLGEPLRWRKPARVFVNSMSDLFHENVPFEFVDQVFAVMAVTPQHTYQILTKRAARMERYFSDRTLGDVYTEAIRSESEEPAFADSPLDHVRGILRLTASWEVRDGYHGLLSPPKAWPLPNVWLGVSVEDQEQADRRIPHLLRTPAAVRFISAEPLLGPIDLNRKECLCKTWRKGLTIGTYLDWVIVGGESGSGARPLHLDWARLIVRQCKDDETPVFVKQLGSNPGYTAIDTGRFVLLNAYPETRLNDRKGGDLSEWPEDLRVREFPATEPTHD